jgi:hypothetical protein
MVLVLLPDGADRSRTLALSGMQADCTAAGLQQQFPFRVHQQGALQQPVEAVVLDLVGGEWVGHWRAVVVIRIRRIRPSRGR